MFFENAYKKIRPVDVSALANRVSALPEDIWLLDEDTKVVLANDRETPSIFLLNIHDEKFTSILERRVLKKQDITRLSGQDILHDDVMSLVDEVLKGYPPNGVILRVQLALLPSGARIHPHLDSSISLKLSHRIHIPLITNSGTRFLINHQLCTFDAGYAYELNNRLIHSAYNKSEHDRVHLIFDYLPPENNYTGVLGRNNDLVNKTYLDDELPTIIATSVIRGAQKQESHGGIYLVDLETEEIQQTFDWNTCDIDFEGRGWDRGLRGIAIDYDHIYVAASDEIFCFDKDFNIIDSFRCPYLKHAHEIFLYEDCIYVTSTGFDSILKFNLKTKEFEQGFMIRINQENQINALTYDPRTPNGPEYGNSLHINMVSRYQDRIFVGGRNIPCVIELNAQKLEFLDTVPLGAHNITPYANGFLCNDTIDDQITFIAQGENIFSMPVPMYEKSTLENAHLGDDLARQGFARGLCFYGNDLIIAGSSPSTITTYSFLQRKQIKSINITKDIRNAVHGLEIWNTTGIS